MHTYFEVDDYLKSILFCLLIIIKKNLLDLVLFDIIGLLKTLNNEHYD